MEYQFFKRNSRSPTNPVLLMQFSWVRSTFSAVSIRKEGIEYKKSKREVFVVNKEPK